MISIWIVSMYFSSLFQIYNINITTWRVLSSWSASPFPSLPLSTDMSVWKVPVFLCMGANGIGLQCCARAQRERYSILEGLPAAKSELKPLDIPGTQPPSKQGSMFCSKFSQIGVQVSYGHPFLEKNESLWELSFSKFGNLQTNLHSKLHQYTFFKSWLKQLNVKLQGAPGQII